MVIFYVFPQNRQNCERISVGFLKRSPLDLKNTPHSLRKHIYKPRPGCFFYIYQPFFSSLFVVSPEDGTAASRTYTCVGLHVFS